MVKTQKVIAMALVGCLGACAEMPMTGRSAGGSNCSVGTSACLLEVTYKPPHFVFPPKFTMSVQPALPPSSLSDVDVFWKLPAGFLFDEFKGDGPQLQSVTAFKDGYVTDALYRKSNLPGPGYHWTIKGGQTLNGQYYWIYFQGPGPDGTTGQWRCDPTITSFGAFTSSATSAAATERAASVPAMDCTFYPPNIRP